MTRVIKKIPYFSQWESSELVGKIIGGKIGAREDPGWELSGAKTSEEYEHWSWNICGMACLKMILASKFEEEHKTIELAKKCEGYGGYVQNREKIDGLFYKPFCKFLANEFQIKAKIFRMFLTIGRIKREVQRGNYFIVSVSSSIRDVAKIPEHKSGHLILITGFDDRKKTLFLHNPSGLHGKSQKNYEITEKDFTKFFAGRGVLIY
ncbi:C39 family peptidase [Candidatus Collierbacteria bacterium]|nr:C39 family peptidase [Candidatus Collierbacteria bacterium]